MADRKKRKKRDRKEGPSWGRSSMPPAAGLRRAGACRTTHYPSSALLPIRFIICADPASRNEENTVPCPPALSLVQVRRADVHCVGEGPGPGGQCAAAVLLSDHAHLPRFTGHSGSGRFRPRRARVSHPLPAGSNGAPRTCECACVVSTMSRIR